MTPASRSVRSRRPRRRRETPSTAWVATRFGLVVAAIGGFLWLAGSVYNGKPWESYSKLYIEVPNTGNLIKHDPVRIRGIRIGQVLSTAVTPTGNARVELQLEPGLKLPQGTAVRVRANGLLGARYVELVPGKLKRDLRDGATVRGGANALTYGVPETLDTFDRETRGALGEMLSGLGDGLNGQGSALNTMLRVDAAAIRPAEQLFDTLRRGGGLQTLLPSLASLTDPLDRSRQDAAASLAPAATTLDALQGTNGALGATLRAAPGALSSATSGLGAGVPLLTQVRRLAVAAKRTLPGAPSALRATNALLDEVPRPLRRTNALLQAAEPAVPAALKITKSVGPLLTPLNGTIQHGIPILDEVGAHACDLTNWAVNLRSMTGLGGTGEGPAGPAMAFRLIPTLSAPTETLGVGDTTGLVMRDGYPAPCKYLSKPYPIFESVGVGK